MHSQQLQSTPAANKKRKKLEHQNTTLILVAGGKGHRMGSAIPKQFLPLAGKPVLYYAVKVFLEAFPAIKIILVLPQEHISYSNILLQAFENRIDLTIVTGGATRFHSVQNGINAAEKDGIIFIHDGVRPLISRDLLERCYQQAVQQGSAVPVIKVTDSIRQWDGMKFAAIDREQLRSVQTPQTFSAALIHKAFEQEYHESFTDEATVVEKSGNPVHLIEGLKENIKITTPEDLLVAETWLNQHNEA